MNRIEDGFRVDIKGYRVIEWMIWQIVFRSSFKRKPNDIERSNKNEWRFYIPEQSFMSTQRFL